MVDESHPRYQYPQRELATIVGPLPLIEKSRDPADNFLLGMAQAGKADFLVTGSAHRRAIAVNVQIMCAFVRMRELLAPNTALARNLDELEPIGFTANLGEAKYPARDRDGLSSACRGSTPSSDPTASHL